MLKVNFKIGVISFLLASIFLEKNTYSLRENEIITVCSEAGYLPFEAKNTQGKWYGFDVEMMQEFAKNKHYKVEFIDVPFESLLLSLISKKCNIIASGMSITPQRQKIVAFSEPIYRTSEAIAISTMQKKLVHINSLQDLDKEGVKISIKTGLTSDLYLSQKGFLKHAVLLKFNSDNEALEAVIEGRADAIVNDKPILLVAAKVYKNKLKILPFILKQESEMPVGVAFRKQDVNLRKEFNQFFAEWKVSGKYQKMITYYFNEMGWLKKYK